MRPFQQHDLQSYTAEHMPSVLSGCTLEVSVCQWLVMCSTGQENCKTQSSRSAQPAAQFCMCSCVMCWAACEHRPDRKAGGMTLLIEYEQALLPDGGSNICGPFALAKHANKDAAGHAFHAYALLQAGHTGWFFINSSLAKVELGVHWPRSLHDVPCNR